MKKPQPLNMIAAFYDILCCGLFTGVVKTTLEHKIKMY
jgi:hypothetical protein